MSSFHDSLVPFLDSLRLSISPTSDLLKCTRQFRFQIVFASKGTFSTRGLTMSLQRVRPVEAVQEEHQ
jgi:hypothetical protein